MDLTVKSVKKIAKNIAELTEAAKALYLGEEEISEELAAELGAMWDLCSEYSVMYENFSRI